MSTKNELQAKTKDHSNFVDDLVNTLQKHGWSLSNTKFKPRGDNPFDEALKNPNMPASEFIEGLKEYTLTLEIEAVYIGKGYADMDSVMVSSIVDGLQRSKDI